jgi:hypothetical protein
MIAGVPDVTTLASDTLTLLGGGVGQSDRMRERLSASYGIEPGHALWPRLVNNHAWALVRLQVQRKIRKLSPGCYEPVEPGEGQRPTAEETTQPIVDGASLPAWAHTLIRAATWKNKVRWKKGSFGEPSLRTLWTQCGGRCALTGLPFRETQVGSGRARRPYAPSLDRIDPEKHYFLENCRLVLQAVNFALNAWGDDVFFEMATAAAARMRHDTKGLQAGDDSCRRGERASARETVGLSRSVSGSSALCVERWRA